MRFKNITLCLSLLAGGVNAQTAPAAITAVPSSSRLDENGDGQLDVARSVHQDGFCGLFVGANRNGFPSNVAQSTGLLTTGSADRFSPDPAFHEFVPFADLDDRNATVVTSSNTSITAP